MLTWKNVGALKASILYIYIYIYILMKGSYSNTLTDISKPSWSLCFGYSYSKNYHLHVSIHCTTWILHCMDWMLMHRLDIYIYIYKVLAWFDYYKHVICALDVLNALYTIYIESVYYFIYIYIYIWIHPIRILYMIG